MGNHTIEVGFNRIFTSIRNIWHSDFESFEEEGDYKVREYLVSNIRHYNHSYMKSLYRQKKIRIKVSQLICHMGDIYSTDLIYELLIFFSSRKLREVGEDNILVKYCNSNSFETFKP